MIRDALLNRVRIESKRRNYDIYDGAIACRLSLEEIRRSPLGAKSFIILATACGNNFQDMQEGTVIHVHTYFVRSREAILFILIIAVIASSRKQNYSIK